MRPYWYILPGVLLLLAAALFLAFVPRDVVRQIGTRSLAGATGVLAVFVDNPSVPPPDTTPPVVTLFGATTITLNAGDTYAEPGATSTDNVDVNLPIFVFIDGSTHGVLLADVALDTSTAATHTLIYKATDNAGNAGSATRTVVVQSTQNSGGGTNGGGSSGGGGGGGGGGGAVVPPTQTTPAKAGQTAPKNKADFNGDGKVDIADFSLLAYWYKRPLTAAAQKYDLNGDGKVTLADFSILAYYWNR